MNNESQVLNFQELNKLKELAIQEQSNYTKFIQEISFNVLNQKKLLTDLQILTNNLMVKISHYEKLILINKKRKKKYRITRIQLENELKNEKKKQRKLNKVLEKNSSMIPMLETKIDQYQNDYENYINIKKKNTLKALEQEKNELEKQIKEVNQRINEKNIIRLKLDQNIQEEKSDQQEILKLIEKEKATIQLFKEIEIVKLNKELLEIDKIEVQDINSIEIEIEKYRKKLTNRK
ncbi:hypothetical protein M0813_15389 [Anaeramoeba flamelloides]|uniref:Uncharacterized protein n=1 Tax=Anaeramoeba flamelloides TaxID=1746091 RepID=A0ABQ8Z114_9EUKA|nr:hypothetical protein M0813_15389 [Anaeramoeba flamelloides]